MLQLNNAAFATFLFGFFVGLFIAKRGSNALSELDRATLASWNPDLVAFAAPIVMIGLGQFLAGQMPLISIIVAAAVFCLWTYRVPYRISKQSWPASARLHLVLGNIVVSASCLAFVIINAAQ